MFFLYQLFIFLQFLFFSAQQTLLLLSSVLLSAVFAVVSPSPYSACFPFFFIICSTTVFLCHPAGFISRHICPPSCQLYLPSVSPPSSRLVLFEAASLAARAKSQWSSNSVISSTMFRTMWLYRNVCIFLVPGSDCWVLFSSECPCVLNRLCSDVWGGWEILDVWCVCVCVVS